MSGAFLPAAGSKEKVSPALLKFTELLKENRVPGSQPLEQDFWLLSAYHCCNCYTVQEVYLSGTDFGRTTWILCTTC